MDGSTPTPSLDQLLGEKRWLQALARRLVRDAATADDLVQETWFRALRAGGSARGGPLDTRAWLGRVLRNVWRERGRAERARTSREEHVAAREALPSARESIERLELAKRLAAFVLELHEPYRSIVVWRYYENRSAAEIAAASGEPASRVRWRLLHARELLRKRLERDRTDWSTHYAIFLPLAQRTLKPAGAASAAAAEIGVLTMATKSLVGWGAAALALLMVITTWMGTFGPTSRSLPAAEPTPLAKSALVLDRSTPRPDLQRTPVPIVEAALAGASRAVGFTTHVHGIVRAAESGRPLANADLALFEPDSQRILARTHSASDGTFHFDGPAIRGFELACRLEGRTPRRKRVSDMTATGDRAHTIDLELGFALTVHVVEEPSGASVTAAAVELVPGDHAAVVGFSADTLAFHALRGVTNSDGRVVLGGGARGVHQYVVRTPHHATALGEVLVEPDTADIRVVVQRGGVVHGTVLDSGRAPVEGARVFLNPAEHVRGLSDELLRNNGVATDRDGRYRIEAVPAGVYHAVALLNDGSGTFHFASGDRKRRALERLLVENGVDVPLDFRLPVPGRVRGRILDPDGSPVVGARVTVSWGDFKAERGGFFPIARVAGVKESIHHATRTSDDGVFELANLRLSHEPLEVKVDAAGFVRGELELDVPVGARLEPVLTLQRLGPTIRGRLTNRNGQPVADWDVGCFESDGTRLGAFFHTKTAADGRYELRVAATSGARHRVQPILRGTSPYRCEPTLREDILGGANDVDFVLQPRRAVTGTVVDDTGALVRDFVVHALTIGSHASWKECNGANRGEGRFELFVDPMETQQLRISAPACDPSSITDLTGDEQRIVLRRAADVEGVVLDSFGRSVAGAVVALATLDSAIYPRGTGFAPRATTDIQGRFRLRGVPDPSLVPGASTASASGHVLVCPRRDDAPTLVRFALPVPRPARLELVLPRSVPVELVFVDAHGRAVEGGVFVLDAAGWPNEPAVEAHLADQAHPSRGVLVDGRARLHLTPGPHRAILVVGSEARETFGFDVTDPGASETVQRTHTFQVGPR